MNKKQRQTLEAVFARPTRHTIAWKDIESLIISLGGTIREGKGSAGVFILQNKIFPFHRPHPQKEAKRYQVEDIRKFLKERGIEP